MIFRKIVLFKYFKISFTRRIKEQNKILKKQQNIRLGICIMPFKIIQIKSLQKHLKFDSHFWVQKHLKLVSHFWIKSHDVPRQTSHGGHHENL